MKNRFKNNSLASCLLGIIIGVGGHAGYDAIKDAINSKQQPQISGIANMPDGSSYPSIEQTNFDRIPENEDGDCLITRKGKRFHNPDGCTYLRKSKQIRLVSSEDAQTAGLTPCSKCM